MKEVAEWARRGTFLALFFVLSVHSTVWATHVNVVRLDRPDVWSYGDLSDVADFASTPDGVTCVFRGDFDEDGVQQLYAVPADGGGPPHRLPLPSLGSKYVELFEVSPDGSRVAFTVGGDGGLYSVSVDAGSDPVMLSTCKLRSFQISPDSQWVVFYGFDALDDKRVLMSAPIDGGSPAVVLDFLPRALQTQIAFKITPDNQTVIYDVGSSQSFGLGQLRSVPLSGGSSPVILSSCLFQTFELTHDSQYVVFKNDESRRLCAVPVKGDAPPLQLTTNDVYPPVMVAAGSRIVFEGPYNVSRPGLYSVPVDGGAPPTLLDTEIVQNSTRKLSPDGTRVFYFKSNKLSGGVDLWAIDLTESPLNPVKVVSNDDKKEVFPDSVRISADGRLAMAVMGTALYCVRLSAPGTPLTTSTPFVLSGHCESTVDFDPSSARAIFVELSDDAISHHSLCTAPWDASSPAVVLNPGDSESQILKCQRAGSTGRLLFIGKNADEFAELFSVPDDGSELPVRLSGESVQWAARIDSVTVTPDQQTVAYRLVGKDSYYESGVGHTIWSAPVDGVTPARNICYGATSLIRSLTPLPDNQRVVVNFLQYPEPWSSSWMACYRLDGSGPEWRTSGDLEGFSNDITKVLLWHSDSFELHTSPFLTVFDTLSLDSTTLGIYVGDSPPSRISPDGEYVAVAGSYVCIQRSDGSTPAVVVAWEDGVALEFTPDSSRLVFISTNGESVSHLYVAPVDLSSSPVQLDASGRVARFGIAPNSQRVFWLSVPPEPNTVDSFELHVSPLDAGSAPVWLGDEVTAAQFTRNSRRIVYLNAGQLFSFGERGELSVPLSGSEAVTQFALSADSCYAVYLAQSNGVNRLFSVPVDGSDLPVCLTPTLEEDTTLGSLSDPLFAISEDNLQVSYVLAKRVTDDTVAYELFSVPIHGGLALLRSDPSTQTTCSGNWAGRNLIYVSAAQSETDGGIFTSLASGGPGVLVRRADSQPASTVELPAKFDLLFDEPVQSFDPDAVMNAGTAPGVVFSAARKGPGRFELVAVGADGDGTIRPSLAAGSAQNENGESNEEAVADLDETVLLDAFVAVPQLAGVTVSEATAILADVDLAVGERTHSYHASVPAGTVISQQPTVGEQVPRGSSVNLVISLGPEQVPVPDLSDKTPDEAEAALSAAGLLMGTVTEAFSDRVPAGKIVSQDPVERTVVSKDSVVNITVSAGPQPVAVPDVVGLDFAAAEALLTNAVLQVGTVASQFSADIPVGAVLQQQPAAQALASPGSKVNLVLSKGPEPGAITVNIEPEEARVSGAQWRVDGGPWQDGGVFVSDMLPGTHTIEFKSISAPYGCYALATKWMTPASQNIEVSSGAITTVSATYVQIIP